MPSIREPPNRETQAALRVCKDQEDSLRSLSEKWASEMAGLAGMRDKISARAAEVDTAQEVMGPNPVDLETA